MFVVSVIFLFIPLVHSQQIAKTADNYGPYNVEYSSFGTCKGPKAKNVTILTVSMNENAVGVVNFTFLADTYFNEIKIQVHNIKDNKKNFLWKYNLNDPCRHYSVAAIIKDALKAENCFVKKGFYYNRINFKNVTLTYMGSSFFYGTYLYKAYLMAKKGNIGCVTATVSMIKKI